MGKYKLNARYLKVENFRGKPYKKAKSFFGRNAEEKAHEFADDLERKHHMRHAPPVVEKMRISKRLGFYYRVIVPKELKL